jgi:hypothetical protein
MLGAETEDNLAWLAEHFTVQLRRDAERGAWHLELYGPGQYYEEGGTSFDGGPDGDLGALIALARDWAQEPLAADLGGGDWLRLCAAAAKRGVVPRDLIRQGARELLDRIDAEG